jgi:dienelactone hydrolase
MIWRCLWLLGLLLYSPSTLDAVITDRGQVPGMPFHRYLTNDRLGRVITFYLSEERSTTRAVPLVVVVQGSGCASQFHRDGDRMISGAQILLHDIVRGRAVVLVVEKPGVEFLDHPADAGEAKNCRPEFLREHTLDRWVEAIAAAIKATQELPGVDRSRTLVTGGSEGGMVAVRVSNLLTSVTHVAPIAGGGPNHLFGLAIGARRKGLDAEKEIYGCWAEILRDPDSTTKFCWGHPHRRWASFLKTSLVQECLKSRAHLYVAHGTADGSSAIEEFDVLRAELAAAGRPAVFERIEGADHVLGLPHESSPAGLVAVLNRVVDWFLASTK